MVFDRQRIETWSRLEVRRAYERKNLESESNDDLIVLAGVWEAEYHDELALSI